MATTPSPRRARGRPVDHQARAERRAQILAAALHCFARKGFHATSTVELSAEAQISIAGLYQYFSSKEELILALIENDLDNGVQIVNNISQSDNFIDGLEAAANAIVEDERLRAFGLIRLEVLAEASRSPKVAEMVAAADHRFIAALMKVLALAQSRGQIRPDLDVYETAIAIICVSDGFYGRLAVPPAMRGPFVSACFNFMRQALSTH